MHFYIANEFQLFKVKGGDDSIPRSGRVSAGPESAGVLGVGEGEVAAEAEADVKAEGGARLSCVGRVGPSAASDTRFIASICSLFSPNRRFAWLPSWGEQWNSAIRRGAPSCVYVCAPTWTCWCVLIGQRPQTEAIIRVLYLNAPFNVEM